MAKKSKVPLVDEIADTVTMQRTDFDALLSELEDAEDRAAVLGHRLARLIEKERS